MDESGQMSEAIVAILEGHEWLGPRREALSEGFGRLAALILEANQRMNLTADASPELFWPRHIEDSLRAGCVIESLCRFGRGEGIAIADVGTGGGLPGLMWAMLWPQARVRLIESRQKRAMFLEEAAGKLRLVNVAVDARRAEVVGHDDGARGAHDLVSARAVAPMASLLELTLPLARTAGWVAAIKGAEVEQELAAAGPALAALGGRITEGAGEYRRSDGRRCRVCLVEAVEETPQRYPRREGVPERRPIGGYAGGGGDNSESN